MRRDATVTVDVHGDIQGDAIESYHGEYTATTDNTGTWRYYYTDSDGKSIIKTHHVLIAGLIVLALLVFHFRHRIAEAHDRYRTRRRERYVGLGGFEGDLERGLHSDTFDIQSNISSGDSREGLSEQASQEIRRMMSNEHLSFDEARLKYTQSQLSKNGIERDGLPRDPKLVTFD